MGDMNRYMYDQIGKGAPGFSLGYIPVLNDTITRGMGANKGWCFNYFPESLVRISVSNLLLSLWLFLADRNGTTRTVEATVASWIAFLDCVVEADSACFVWFCGIS